MLNAHIVLFLNVLKAHVESFVLLSSRVFMWLTMNKIQGLATVASNLFHLVEWSHRLLAKNLKFFIGFLLEDQHITPVTSQCWLHPSVCVLSCFSCVCLCSLSGSSGHGSLQVRTLEWVDKPSSRGSSRPRDWAYVSYNSCAGRRVLYH